MGAEFKSYKYTYGLTTLRKYGNNFLKLTTMNVQRTPHTESPNKGELNYTFELDPFTGEYDKVYNLEVFERLEKKAEKEREYKNKPLSEKASIDNKKMVESLLRSKRVVFEYAFSNDWQYFATFTIDKTKFDRYNLNEYHDKFSHWLRNYFRRKYGENVQYLCIPEMHKDGAWHEHALISGISEQHLELFQLDDNLPKYINDKLKNNEKIYNCPAYQKKFGFCTFEPVRSSEACAKYITKYITKDLEKSVSKLNAKIYYASRGIKKAEVIKCGYYDNYIEDFKNCYCKQGTFAYDDELLEKLKDKIKGL